MAAQCCCLAWVPHNIVSSMGVAQALLLIRQHPVCWLVMTLMGFVSSQCTSPFLSNSQVWLCCSLAGSQYTLHHHGMTGRCDFAAACSLAGSAHSILLAFSPALAEVALVWMCCWLQTAADVHSLHTYVELACSSRSLFSCCVVGWTIMHAAACAWIVHGPAVCCGLLGSILQDGHVPGSFPGVGLLCLLVCWPCNALKVYSQDATAVGRISNAHGGVAPTAW